MITQKLPNISKATHKHARNERKCSPVHSVTVQNVKLRDAVSLTGQIFEPFEGFATLFGSLI